MIVYLIRHIKWIPAASDPSMTNFGLIYERIPDYVFLWFYPSSIVKCDQHPAPSQFIKTPYFSSAHEELLLGPLLQVYPRMMCNSFSSIYDCRFQARLWQNRRFLSVIKRHLLSNCLWRLTFYHPHMKDQLLLWTRLWVILPASSSYMKNSPLWTRLWNTSDYAILYLYPYFIIHAKSSQSMKDFSLQGFLWRSPTGGSFINDHFFLSCPWGPMLIYERFPDSILSFKKNPPFDPSMKDFYFRFF